MLAAGGYAFGPYRLDTEPLRLLRAGALVGMPARQLAVLHVLVSRAGEIVPKDHLAAAGWSDPGVTDNSVARVIFEVRQQLDPADPGYYITTIARRGYKFVAAVTRDEPVNLAALLGELRPWTEGRAALETLERSQIARALAVFEQLLVHYPRDARVHVGLANSRIMQFEATRTDAAPDVESRRVALEHAEEACRLNPKWAEVWATLGFILERTGERAGALLALERAVKFEPKSLAHLLRLAAASWGRRRIEAVDLALVECSDLPMARWLAASLYVARGSLGRAEEEVHAGLPRVAVEGGGAPCFATVAIDWLDGLLRLARGAEDEAAAAFDRELALEARGHVYARECAANTWCAKGALHLRRGNHDAARAAFAEAIARVPRLPMAHAGLAILNDAGDTPLAGAPLSVDHAFARAAVLVWRGDAHAAAGLVDAALEAAPPGNAGWRLSIEPLLDVGRAPEAWSRALARLHVRACC